MPVDLAEIIPDTVSAKRVLELQNVSAEIGILGELQGDTAKGDGAEGFAVAAVGRDGLDGARVAGCYRQEGDGVGAVVDDDSCAWATAGAYQAGEDV